MQRVTDILLMLAVAVLSAPVIPNRAFVAAASPTENASGQSLAIIVNQSNSIENLSFEDLRRVFFGEQSHWPNGRRITLVMTGPGQPERRVVLRDIYRMDEKDFNKHVLQGMFTGEIFVPPKTLATSLEVRKFVFNVPGAIGFVRTADVDGSVKVIRVDGRLPDDKEYKLRMDARSGK